MRVTLICLALFTVTILAYAEPEAEAEANAEPRPLALALAKKSSRVHSGTSKKWKGESNRNGKKCGCCKCKKKKKSYKKCKTIQVKYCPNPGLVGGNGSNSGVLGNGGNNVPASTSGITGGGNSGAGNTVATTAAAASATNGIANQATTASASASKNYCGFSCGTDHIGCNNADTLKSTCPTGASIVTFSDSEKQLFVDLHNQFRNTAANGVNGLTPAARMGKVLNWDDDLAYLSGLNTRTCQEVHDSCRITDKFVRPGQNIGFVGTSPGEYSNEEGIRLVVSSWFNENTGVSNSDIQSFNGRSGIDHFTQLVWSNSTAIGCGATRYSENDLNNILITCNYAVGNVLTWPVYLQSSTAGSGCTTGTDPTYTGICSASEPLDPNYFWSG